MSTDSFGHSASDDGHDVHHIVFDGVSKFYGQVLGVHEVDLVIEPGVTSLVGPNGAGKTTLLNLMAGLLRPTRGRVRVLGMSPEAPQRLHRRLGYCTQYDGFPPGLTGLDFVRRLLELHGHAPAEAERLAWGAVERVGLEADARRRIAGYSKGMRQRIKLAGAIAHRPAVMLLDEPLNGLDPVVRGEIIALLRALGAEGLHVIVSSHILHEVDLVSDRVVMIEQGYVTAKGAVDQVRGELSEHPARVSIRCDRPEELAARAVRAPHVTGVQLHDDRRGLEVHTRDADAFHLQLNRIVVEAELSLQAVAPVDDGVDAVYHYLIEGVLS